MKCNAETVMEVKTSVDYYRSSINLRTHIDTILSIPNNLGRLALYRHSDDRVTLVYYDGEYRDYVGDFYAYQTDNGSVSTDGIIHMTWSNFGSSEYEEYVGTVNAPLPIFTDFDKLKSYVNGSVSLVDLVGDFTVEGDYEFVNGEIVGMKKEYNPDLGYPRDMELVRNLLKGEEAGGILTWQDDTLVTEEYGIEVYCDCDIRYRDYIWKDWVVWDSTYEQIYNDVGYVPNDGVLFSSSDFKNLFDYRTANSFLGFSKGIPTYMTWDLHTKARYYVYDMVTGVYEYGDWIHCLLKDAGGGKTESTSWCENGTVSVDDDTTDKQVADYDKDKVLDEDYGIFEPIVRPFINLLDGIKNGLNSVSRFVNENLNPLSKMSNVINQSFGFMPEWVLTFIGSAVVIAIFGALIRKGG